MRTGNRVVGLWSKEVVAVALAAAATFGCGSRVITIGDQRTTAEQKGDGATNTTPPASTPPIALVFPEASCRSGPLYVERFPASGPPNSAAAECDLPPGQGPGWLNYTLCETLVTNDFASAGCRDGSWGLSPSGELTNPRGPTDLPIYSLDAPSQNIGQVSCDPLAYTFCHLGGLTNVVPDCGEVPSGTGGNIVPGTYVLSGYVDHVSDAYPAAGSYIWQTLNVTASSVHLVSGDGGNFSISATYTYAVEGARIVFTKTACVSGTPLMPIFPRADATFTASDDSLELFDAERHVRAMFTRIR